MVKKFSNYCVYIYCFVMFIIYPLFFKNGYYDIGIAKYDFFVVFHMVALLVMCPLILWKEKIEFSLLDKVVWMAFGGATIVFALGILNRFSVYPIDMKVEHTAFISTSCSKLYF